MKIGDEVFVHGYVDEIRKDVIIIRNNGGYFGTIEGEIVIADTPQTESHITCYGTCTDKCGAYEKGDCILNAKQADTPQTESTGSPIGDYRDGVGAWQTDCSWR